MIDPESIRMRLKARGQEHALRFLPRLDAASRERLLKQLNAIDLDQLDRLVAQMKEESAADAHDFGPAEVIRLPCTEAERAEAERARLVGERLLREGKVACVVVAGGQGTRLGYDHPKGAYPLMPVSGKSLFQHHVEKVLALANAFGASVPFCVMTSETNDVETRSFFRERGNFGLADEDLFIFAQGMLPAVDFDGKLILDAPDHVFASPNGHGGVLTGLVESGVARALRERGIEEFFHFQIDNPLARIADPVFMGFHRERRAQMSAKVVRKRDPFEGLGLVVRRADGRAAVIEYSELDEERARRAEADGSLTWWPGSIAIHAYRLDFVEDVGSNGRLPFHVAKKKIPRVDEEGRAVSPEKPNGCKFEMFVFDALPMAERTVIMETERREEFAPVKNREGEDSIDTSRALIVDLFARWLESAGVDVPRDADGRTIYPIEISPLYARDEAELKRKLKDPRSMKIDGPTMIG